MALTFFSIVINNGGGFSSRPERQAEEAKEFEAKRAKEFEKLNNLLDSGWTVVASYTTEGLLGFLILRCILYKKSEQD